MKIMENMNGISKMQKDHMATELTIGQTFLKKALFKKEGQSNILYRGIQEKRTRYMKDIYITLLDIRWRYALLIVFAGFFISCFLFSLIYFFIGYLHGDFEHSDDPNRIHCIVGMRTFWDALLFSIETQSTIGYGSLYPQSKCGISIPVVFLQVTIGFLLETMLLGFIFMKVARPKHRRHTLIFSHDACVCVQDKHLVLQIRLGDIRNSHLIDAHLYGILVKKYVTAENYVFPLYQQQIEFQADGMKDHLFLFYPMVLSHKITADSPLYTLAPEDLPDEPFELLLILEGTIESTGEMVQAKTSISNMEVRWGYRFEQIEEYDENQDKWFINFNMFDHIVPIETPRCSAKDLTCKTILPTEPDVTVKLTSL